MPASEARISANRTNALKSTGPKTEEGKARSRANSYKHGLTGAGVVMPEEDAVEVDRLARALREELKPTGPSGEILVRRMATLSVRMDRCAARESAAIAENVRKAMDEFEAPEGVDEATAEMLRVEAGKIALFDPSKPACLARQHEAAAERNFFRALKELRQLKKDQEGAAPVAAPSPPDDALGSFSKPPREVARREVSAPQPLPKTVPILPPLPADLYLPGDFANAPTWVDVPLAIGRPR